MELSGLGALLWDLHPDQAVPRYKLCKLFLTHSRGAVWAHRQYHVADFGRAIVDGDLLIIPRIETELTEESAGLEEGAGAVVVAFVPVRRGA